MEIQATIIGKAIYDFDVPKNIFNAKLASGEYITFSHDGKLNANNTFEIGDKISISIKKMEV